MENNNDDIIKSEVRFLRMFTGIPVKNNFPRDQDPAVDEDVFDDSQLPNVVLLLISDIVSFLNDARISAEELKKMIKQTQTKPRGEDATFPESFEKDLIKFIEDDLSMMAEFIKILQNPIPKKADLSTQPVIDSWESVDEDTQVVPPFPVVEAAIKIHQLQELLPQLFRITKLLLVFVNVQRSFLRDAKLTAMAKSIIIFSNDRIKDEKRREELRSNYSSNKENQAYEDLQKFVENQMKEATNTKARLQKSALQCIHFLNELDWNAEHADEVQRLLLDAESQLTSMTQWVSDPNAPSFPATSPSVVEVLTKAHASSSSNLFDAAFEEVFHWHSGKLFVEDKPVDFEKQTYGAFMEKYAESLKPKLTLSGSLDFGQDVFIQAALGLPSSISFEKLDSSCTSKSLNFLEYGQLDNLKAHIKDLFRGHLWSEGVNGLFLLLSGYARRLNATFGVEDLLHLFEVVAAIHYNFKHLLDPTHSRYLRSFLTAMGFRKLANTLEAGDVAQNILEKRSWVKLFPCATKVSALVDSVADEVDTVDFELKHFGPLMTKLTYSKEFKHPDVPFVPDGWQFDLLKAIEQEKSALVVVPTSAGKSFVSFFTISKALERVKSDKVSLKGLMQSRIVFVAPTVALANQMAANVYARHDFELLFIRASRYKSTSFGVFTSDYRQNVFGCSILICTPSIFRILLTAPLYSEWRQNLVYVILDEIHLIASKGLEGDDKISRDYSQIFQFITCPFVALSATMNNGDELVQWMVRVNNNPSRQILRIPDANYPKVIRWADLSKSLIAIEDESPKFIAFHPVALLEPDTAAREIDLSPDEVSELDAAIRSALATSPSLLQNYNENYSAVYQLPSTKILVKNEVAAVAASIMNFFFTKLRPAEKEEVISLITGSMKFDVPQMQRMSTYPILMANLSKIMLKMKAENAVPAIFFHFDTGFLDDSLPKILSDLERMDPGKPEEDQPKKKSKEKKDKSSSSAAAEEDESYLDSRRSFANEEAQAEKEAIKRKIETVRTYFNSIDLSSSLLTAADTWDDLAIDVWLTRLFSKVEWSANNPLLKALMRGVAIYYAGLPKPYRDIVEYLFRRSFVKVVLSSSALAIGVNMPAKSVVFLTDYPKVLNPVLFKQMIGRAGRRGFDSVGQAFFVRFNKSRLRELLFDDNLKIIPNCRVDLDTTLRLDIMFAETKNPNEIPEITRRFLDVPYDQTQGAESRILWTFWHQLLQQLRLIGRNRTIAYDFMSEFLPDFSLDKPIGLAGFVSHSDAYPASFALAYLIFSGDLLGLAEPYSANLSLKILLDIQELRKYRVEKKFALLNLLAYLLGKRRRIVQNQMSIVVDALLLERLENYNYFIDSNANVYILQAGLTPAQADILRSELPKVVIRDAASINSLIVAFYKMAKETPLDKGVSLASLERSNGVRDNASYSLLKDFESILRKMNTALAMLDPEDSFFSSPLIDLFADLTADFSAQFRRITY